MENKEVINSQEIQIQGLLNNYLRQRISKNLLSQPMLHLDEDTLASFTEGVLSENETIPVIKHLVNCSFCRQVTKELVKLDLVFADDEIQVTTAKTSPSKISEVLNTFLSSLFGTGDGAVFAHQEKDENSDKLESPKSEEN